MQDSNALIKSTPEKARKARAALAGASLQRVLSLDVTAGPAHDPDGSDQRTGELTDAIAMSYNPEVTM